MAMVNAQNRILNSGPGQCSSESQSFESANGFNSITVPFRTLSGNFGASEGGSKKISKQEKNDGKEISEIECESTANELLKTARKSKES